MHFDASAYLRLDQPQSLGIATSGASFATSTGDILDVSSWGPGIFCMRVGPRTRPDYRLLVGRSKPCEVMRGDNANHVLIAGDCALEILGSPLRFRLWRRDAIVLQSTTDMHSRGFTRLPTFGRLRQGGRWTAAFALASGEAVYGLGGKFGPLDRRGQLIHSQVVDAQSANTGLAYKNAPFAWSPGVGPGAWGIFVNTPAYVAHGVGHPDWSHRSYAVVVDDEALDLFVFAGATPADIIGLYGELTGRAPEVPAWSLGVWISRGQPTSPADAATLATRLRESRMPADVMTIDDRATWNPEMRFDAPADAAAARGPDAALAPIKSRGFRVCISDHPFVAVHTDLFQEMAGRRFLLTTPEGDPYVLHVDALAAAASGAPPANAPPDCGMVDFSHPAAYAWWRDSYESLFAAGVDVIHADFGEQVPDDAIAFNGDAGSRLHNVYPLLYNHCLHEATAKFVPPHEAPMIVGRSGWTGSQRYPLQGDGHVQSDWEGLAASIRGSLSWGMSGAPYDLSDVGGSYGATMPAPELLLRWLQAKVFSSHLRVRGFPAQDLWLFAPEIEAVARKWLAFRYRLLPYLRSVVADAVETGLPVMRAMPLAFPGNALLRSYETQFMCGDALFVAPIVREGGQVEIALPPGVWYDLNSRQKVGGGRVIRFTAALDQFPVFGRGGHTLPLGPAVQHSSEVDHAKMLERLWVFGRPTATMPGFVQAGIEFDAEGAPSIVASGEVTVELFGDAAGVPIVVG